MFLTPRPRQFEYKPVFFDPKKEENRKRVDKAEKLGNNDLASRLHAKFAAHKHLGHIILSKKLNVHERHLFI